VKNSPFRALVFVTHVHWDAKVEMPVGVIPDSVTHLQFDEEHDFTIHPDSIPSSVTHLAIGVFFRQHAIDPTWVPDSVTHLALPCHDFTGPIHFPPSVF
jgi:hypothetical protein